ncbi:myosin-2 essential light chain-like [Pomacea canaliculata]|uniref:myosin-2 essential light chain-like n=1 Tax=Pomacea canaliculata TaxID=400727 RepID=UPI000D7320D8|nr:myosin-2 essential light chain-like [Pomacea canaliculata]
MAKYTEDDLNEIKETFCLFDTKGDDKIAACQLGDVLRSLGQNPTEQEIRKCGYSQSPDARISFETFFPILQTITKSRSIPPLQDFIEGFRVFDKEQNGFIASAELRHVLTCLGEKLSDDEVDQLFQGIEDQQGNINYEELIKMVLNG